MHSLARHGAGQPRPPVRSHATASDSARTLPGTGTGKGTRNPRIPLVSSGAIHTRASVDHPARTTATVDKRAGILRVMQDVHHLALTETATSNSPLCGPLRHRRRNASSR
jgi:hypothetical protein